MLARNPRSPLRSDLGLGIWRPQRDSPYLHHCFFSIYEIENAIRKGSKWKAKHEVYEVIEK